MEMHLKRKDDVKTHREKMPCDRVIGVMQLQVKECQQL